MKFVELTQYPKFIDLEYGEKEPDSINFYTTKPKKVKEKEIKRKGFSNKTNRTKLAKNYCKAINEKNKGKIKTLISILKHSHE